MERRDARIEAKVKKSVVVIGEVGGNDYCSGFVAKVDTNDTYVVTQSNFVGGREDRLKVCFFDLIELPALVVQSVGRLCLLRTAPHPRCERIQWAKDDITLSRAFIFPPSSPTTVYPFHIFVTLESLESYRSRPTDFADGSDNYFLVSCPYTERTLDGYNRIVAAPVFNVDERASGIVVMDCRSGHGAEMKVVLSAKKAMSLISTLIPPGKSKRGRVESSTDKEGKEKARSKRR